MEEKISTYLKENKVLTIATSVDDKPYCASCFYAYDETDNLLIFSSDDHTKHIIDANLNKVVAGTICTEVTTIVKIQGIQFTGTFINPSEEEVKALYSTYYEKFPFARAKPAPIWAITLNWIKMTDNTLGFGKKLEWER
ncbi:MAG: hypothetical protein P1U41_07950 [Vicingaceae bacterium]|nr:hypothetical protein [Vicingaceae bacterium]